LTVRMAVSCSNRTFSNQSVRPHTKWCFGQAGLKTKNVCGV